MSLNQVESHPPESLEYGSPLGSIPESAHHVFSIAFINMVGSKGYRKTFLLAFLRNGPWRTPIPSNKAEIFTGPQDHVKGVLVWVGPTRGIETDTRTDPQTDTDTQDNHQTQGRTPDGRKTGTDAGRTPNTGKDAGRTPDGRLKMLVFASKLKRRLLGSGRVRTGRLKTPLGRQKAPYGRMTPKPLTKKRL